MGMNKNILAHGTEIFNGLPLSILLYCILKVLLK